MKIIKKVICNGIFYFGWTTLTRLPSEECDATFARRR